MRVVTLVCVASVVVAASATAQPESAAFTAVDATRLQLDATAAVGVPVGELRDNVGTNLGGTVGLSYRVGDTPLRLGADVSFFRYGTETRRVPLSLTVPDVLVDVDSGNNILQTHALVRVQPRTGRVRPYVDGLFGFSHFYTRTTVDLDDQFDGGSAGTTHLGDWAPSVGLGGGGMIDLVVGRETRLSLDLGVRYLAGGHARYLTPGDIHREGETVTLDVRRSRTDHVSVRIGVAFDF